jgi:signal transduction histidine kinase
MFIQPIKKVAVDIFIYFLINTTLIYGLLFLIGDSTIAMIGMVWVGIIAWRGGLSAGLAGGIAIIISSSLAITLPPHEHVATPAYFNNKMPGIVMGILQCFIVAMIVGSISTLINKLRMEISLRATTQKALEQKIAELDAFGHTVAHNLKNPLMVINMSIDALLSEFMSSDNVKAKRKLAFINDGTKQMINIIESILMLAGVKKIEKREFGLFQMSQSVDESLARMAYNIEFNDVRVTKPDNWPTVFGYAPWITEVWANYINNAIKYGGKPSKNIKPTIELGFDAPAINPAANTENIRFWIKDNGEGIEKDKIATLFKEFTRLHSSGEGQGLGLSIVKTIIEKFKGNIGVESDVGKGSRFYFTLPTTMPTNDCCGTDSKRNRRPAE